MLVLEVEQLSAWIPKVFDDQGFMMKQELGWFTAQAISVRTSTLLNKYSSYKTCMYLGVSAP